MLQFFTKRIFYIFSNHRTIKNQLKKRRYSIETLSGVKHIANNEETLQGRFVLYLRDSLKSQNTLKFNENITKGYNKDFNKIMLNKMSVFNLYEAICVIKNSNKISKFDFMDSLLMVNNECCSRLNNLTIDEILYLLNGFMQTYSHRITELQFYKQSMQKLSININQNSKSQLIQLCFYVSAQKKTKNANKILKLCLKRIVENYLDKLTCFDVSIICSSTFKTSTKINDERMLQKCENTLFEDLNIFNDSAIFITILKTIRQNRFQNDDFLITVSNVIFFNKTIDQYNFAANCHILALYADALFYEENLLTLINSKCLEQLKNCSHYVHRRQYLKHHIRGKDIARYLWGFSHIGYQLESNAIKTVVLPCLAKRIKNYEFKNEVDILVDCVLCLWMLNYRPNEIIHDALSYNNIDTIRKNKFSRCKQRLNLLLTCILLEDKDLFNKLNVKLTSDFSCDFKYQISKRPTLEKIHEILKTINGRSDVNKYDIHMQIPHLQILGITGYRNNLDKAVFIEVLDSFVSVTNKENFPNGYMQLKLRLLKTFKCPIVTIHEDEVQDLSDEELKEVLEEEIFLASC